MPDKGIIIQPGDPEFNDPSYKEGWGNSLPPKEAMQKKMSELGSTYNHALPTTAVTPYFHKTAQSSDINTIFTNPMWFSPLHTPQSWQIASRRREIYQWSFVSSKKPCFLTKYGDFSLEKIEDIYTLMNSKVVENKDLYIQNAKSQPAKIDIATKRHVKKKANEIKVMGISLPITVTHDHDCMVVEKKQVKCSKGINKSKNCIRNMNSPICQGIKCRKWETVDYEISKKKARDVKKGDYFLVPFSKEVKESVIKTEAQAKFAGHLASDGCVSPDRVGVRIFMHSDEVEYVLPPVKETFNDFGFSPGVKTSRHSQCLVTARTGSIAITEFAKKLVKGKSINKKFTEEVMLLEPELQKHVLGAYIQSDGSLSKSSDNVEITTISPHLANQLLMICFRCGILAFCGRYNISQSSKTFPTKNKHRYVITIPSSDVYSLAPYVPGKLGIFNRDEDEENEEFVYTYTMLDGDMGKVNQLIPPKKKRTHNKRFFWKNYVITPVTANTSFDYEGDVYDVRAPDDFTVTANGVAIHQCRFFYQCFTPENLVLMANGTEKRIDKIKRGDLIIAGDGSSQEVKNIFKRWTKEKALEIGVSGNTRKIKCTNNHIIPSIDKDTWRKSHLTTPSERRKKERLRDNDDVEFRIKWDCAENLSLNSFLYTPSTNIGNGYDASLEKCYVFGAFVAEGSYYWHLYKGEKKRTKGIRFSINKNEVSDDNSENLFGNRIIRFLKKSQHNKVSLYSAGKNEKGVEKNSCDISVSNVDFTEEFYKFCGNNPKIINFDFINSASKEQLLSFLAGYIDGDGCYNVSNGCQIITFDKNLASQISFICEKLKLTYSLSQSKSSGFSDGENYDANNVDRFCIRISRFACESLKKYSCKITNLDVHNTKYGNYLFVDDKIYRKINSISEFTYEGYVYDLEIDNVHSYCVNRMAVHNSEPKVAAGIDFYSQFPVNGFKLVWPHSTGERKLLKFFERETKRLDLVNILRQISSEYYMLGDVFPHADISCPTCKGNPYNPMTGEMCNHAGGNISRIKILNPDWIEVTDTIFADEEQIVLIPDEQIVRIVSTKQPRQIYDRLSPQIRQLVMAQKPILLSNRVVSHLKHMPAPYGIYGTSLIRRLFTTLAYKTKIMTANWIVAERLIIPVRIVKIGSDNRPATSADIAEFNQMLAATTNDPNLTLVTHHNLDYDWIGACHDEETEVLTSSGFKKYGSFDSDEEILTYNVYTKRLEYQKPQAFHEFDYDGDLVHFEGKQIDIKVTPNHRMLVQKRRSDDWHVKFADEVRSGDHLLAHAQYDGEKFNPVVNIHDQLVDLKDFLSFVGYYLSEGSIKFNKKRREYIVTIDQSPKINPKICECIEKTLSSLPYKYSVLKNDDKNRYRIFKKSLCVFLEENFGRYSRNKKIPNWIKNLPSDYLRVLINSLMNGDGYSIKNIHTRNKIYTTISKTLADDVQEIAFKSGYNVRILKEKTKNVNIVYRVRFSEGKWSKGNEPRLKKHHISRVPYKGKVWCFTVPNGFFVTRRNGKIAIQGNSGKILQLGQEMEHIDKEMLDGLMLNQALLNGEMCLTGDHEVLTDSGYKMIDCVEFKDQLCVWDDDNRTYRFENPRDIFKYEDVDDIFEIHCGRKILFKCTGAHKIVIRPEKDHQKHDTITAKELFNNESQHVYTLMRDGNYCEITNVVKKPHKNAVYCFKTSTGYFMARYRDFEFISSNSGYQCHDVDQTEVLTQSGFKKYDDITEDDLIGTFNEKTEELEYQPYSNRYDYSYDGRMIHFKSKRMDCLVTPNHRMLIRNRNSRNKDKWEISFAKDVTPSHQFRTVVNKWQGRNNFPKTIRIDNEYELDLEDYIKLVCYFAAEGSIRRETRKERSTFGEPATTTICQSEKGKAFIGIKKLSDSISYRVRHYAKYDQFCIHNKKLTTHLISACGSRSENKRIPSWIKELPTRYLHLAINCLIEGDGYLEHSVKNGYQYGFEVKSKQLAEDLYEIAFKCGYSPLMAKRKRRDLWAVDFSDAPSGRYPYLTSKYIEEENYKGRIFCFTVPNGLFITRRNGKISIHGNSAQVGVEVLIRRLEAWRTTLAEWVEERIFKPIAQMKGLIDKEASEESGENIWLYPILKWNDLNLKDKTQWYQLLMQLHDKQVISTQTLCDELDLNYDQEVERLRYEMAQAGPMGAQLGGMGEMGGGMLGGGLGGGGISAPGGGAAAPPPPGGIPGMPGGEMGGGMPAPGGAPGGAASPIAAGQPMKVLKRSKAKAIQEKQEPMQFGQVKFTGIEQEFRKMLDNVVSTMKISSPYYFQYKVEKTAGGQPYSIDFAFPKLRLGVELDGSVWHSNPKQVQHDRQRDNELAMKGWTVLRFDDKTMESQPNAVQNVVVSYLQKAMSRGRVKRSKVDSGDGDTNYITVYADRLINVYKDELPEGLIKLALGEEEC